MRNLFVFLMGLLFILFMAPSAFAEESLQQLINQTPENGVLELEAKQYNGNITINKTMTLKGQAGTIIRGDGTHNVITLKASNVTLENLMIQNSGMSRSSDIEYSGVRIIGENNVLRKLTISEIYHGIYLNQAKNTTIQEVHITGHGADKLGNQGYGIYIMRSGENTIEDSYITKTRDGVYIEYSNWNKITNNTLTETRYGIHYMYSNNNEFRNNHFVNNVGGAAIMHSDSILLEENQFSYNQGSRSFGLLIQSSRDIVVRNNEFHLNQRGLYLEQSSNNIFEANDFFHNQIGVELWTSSTAQVFIKNKFNKNTHDVITVGGVSVNEWHNGGIGNYWNKPMLDLNQDGIGDAAIEYTSSLHELLEDNEIAYLFLNSPAITIYEKINALLGNQKIMAEDQYPLIQERKGDNHIASVAVIVVITFGLLYLYRRRKKQ